MVGTSHCQLLIESGFGWPASVVGGDFLPGDQCWPSTITLERQQRATILDGVLVVDMANVKRSRPVVTADRGLQRRVRRLRTDEERRSGF
ncbi:MAG TPA: hypothetical protein VLX59_14280 [Acidimicrobiales bacterium]|nr:hypothetical protein [Acidimicrobiales bacterium]